MGIDPGLICTGYGLIELIGKKPRLCSAGVIKADSAKPLGNRLNELYNGVGEILKESVADFVVVESLYTRMTHPVTATVMAHARGVIFLACAKHRLEPISYHATRVKVSLIGRGRAGKEQVQLMVQNILGLSKLPEPPDVADALAIALCHANTINHSRE